MPRGNRHFGVNSGDFGQIRMLPAPSIFAGALRSFIASRDKRVFDAIKEGEAPEVAHYKEILGSIEEPGTFKIVNVLLSEMVDGLVKPIYPMPSDLVVFEDDGKIIDIATLMPIAKPSVINLLIELPKIAVLKAPNKKPAGGYYLRETGYKKYLLGQKLGKEDLIKEASLWSKEMRTGIALGKETRAAIDGMLYTAEALSFKESMGFIVTVEGADALLAKKSGDLSLGGDQRAAYFTNVMVEHSELDYNLIQETKKFKLVLTSPAIFDGGWLPNWVDDDFVLRYKDCEARLVCASVNGSDTVSGWNMVEKKPKTAVRTVPTGSVYWFEDFSGSLESLKELVKQGFWNKESKSYDKQRVVEGFNRAIVAAYNN